MDKKTISTQLGNITCYLTEVNDTLPIIFLHGVYLDHTLWDDYVDIKNHTTITLDMPLHGESREGVPAQWTVDDCAEMLIEILDKLGIHRVIAIGHSWGSMTILRAATTYSERFASIGLCNMPFEGGTLRRKITFFAQHIGLFSRDFYTKKAAESLMHKPSKEQIAQLSTTMGRLTAFDIMTIDKTVITHVDDTSHLLGILQVPALSLKGKYDYVPDPDPIPFEVVEGGHISPWESPKEVKAFIQKVIQIGL